ncbi:helix-turn-helix transcriptional regulator [Pseudomonas boanensis]|uniref:helix-turn-helix transcriptional regulator n=1 Tax=Metapseudomonas boanensis TaxID=2822138 RepID=UPI0035D47266
MAEAAAMSRSAFAARFTARVGEPAMQYLTRWRMNLALGWLREGDVGIATLAERLGYRSEAAFSRAFKRCQGGAPGAVRRGGWQSYLGALWEYSYNSLSFTIYLQIRIVTISDSILKRSSWWHFCALTQPRCRCWVYW